MKQKRVGIVGTMMSGKTTLADTVVAIKNYRRLALADPVKELGVKCVKMMLIELGYPERAEAFTRADLEKNKHIFRPLLQWIGTEFGRQYVGPDTIWIDKLLERAAYYNPDPIVCDDIRFENEADLLRKEGFVVFRITRDEGKRMKALTSKYSPEEIGSILNHASETAVPHLPVDYEVPNNGNDLSDFPLVADFIDIKVSKSND